MKGFGMITVQILEKEMVRSIFPKVPTAGRQLNLDSKLIESKEKSRFILSETASELNITVVDVLKRAATAPGAQLDLQPEQLWKMSERLKKQGLDALIELGRRVRPGPSNTARVYGDHVHSTLDLTQVMASSQQTPLNPGGDMPPNQPNGPYENPLDHSLNELRRTLQIMIKLGGLANFSIDSNSSLSLAGPPPPPKIALNSESLTLQQHETVKPVQVSLYQYSLMSRTPLHSAPLTPHSSAFSNNSPSPHSPLSHMPSSATLSTYRNPFLTTRSAPNIPSRTSMGYTSGILEEGRRDLEEKWAAAENPGSYTLPEGSRLSPEILGYGRPDYLGGGRRSVSAPAGSGSGFGYDDELHMQNPGDSSVSGWSQYG
ncbi:hypothetical protein G7Y89_g13075 [Cudoniella acicularis]|uniref:Uncharacterized protein n=1 Tax=Cudoniella acicularis TaxID=354080 RepID=A0A8H4VYL0_9HELO|nr:hypothetical protein G7Y89_g13075 [Cudoniella acicularis]